MTPADAEQRRSPSLAVVAALVGILIVAALVASAASAPPLRILDTGYQPLPPASDRAYRIQVVDTGNPSIGCRDPRREGVAVEATCAPG